jgi:autotransporter-associated beta strand protein
MFLKVGLLRILWCCCILFGSVLCTKIVQATPPSGTTWGLLHADEFGGTSVDTQKWITQYPWGPTHNHDAYALPQNLSVANGVLTETAKRETAPDGKPFTTGVISSGYDKMYQYGYAEARIKLPTTPGSWPAFWGLYYGWPPESDIMEFPIFTSGDTLQDYYISYHYTNDSGNAAYGGWADPGSAGNLTTSFHTYGMEWTSTYIKYYFDGAVMRTVTDTAAIADLQSMYLILNYAVGGSWPGTPDTTQWPVGATDTTQVDYVRVWKNTSGYSTATSWTLAGSGSWDTTSNWSSDSPQINTQTATFGSVAASNVTVDWTNSKTVGGLVFNSPVNYTLGNGNDSIMLTGATPITSDQPNATTVLIDASSATGSSPNVINSRLELYNNVTIRSPNKPLTINGPITGLGSLRIESGQINLNNSASYSGTTTIAGGTLKLGASPVTVAHRWSFNNSYADSVGGSTATPVNVGANNVTINSTQVTLAGGTKDTSDYVRLGSNLLPNTNTPIAIELWATPRSVQNWSRIFDFGSSETENLLMSWTTGSNQNSDRVEWKDAATNTSDNTNQPYALNSEYHIVMLLSPQGSSTEVKWYMAPAGSADLGPARSSFVSTNTLSTFLDTEDNLGRSFYPDNTANASYNEVRFWNGPINSTILEILHDAGPNANLSSLGIGMAGGELPSTTALNLSSSGATLDLNGIYQTVGSLSGAAGSSLLLGSGRLTTGGSGTSTTFYGDISGTGGIVKNGAGSLTLAGTLSFGSMHIAGGSVRVNSLSASMNDITGSGTLYVGNGSVAAQLAADTLAVSSLVIAAGSKITIRPLASNPLAGDMQAVPEPSSMILVLTGVLAAMLWRRRKRLVK